MRKDKHNAWPCTLSQTPMANTSISWRGKHPICSPHLEDVGPSVGDHGQAEEEEEDADGRGELAPPRPEGVREHVHQARHQGLHDAELAVDADRLLENEKESIFLEFFNLDSWVG